MLALHTSTMSAAVVLLAGLMPAFAQLTRQLDTRDQILQSSRTLAFDLMSLYNGNQSGQIPGILPGPPPQGDYYWWEGGALMGAMVDYWHLTGDDSYNQVVSQGLLYQIGQNQDYMPTNWTASMGNDDQCLWGSAAMLAAEHQFPNPPSDQPPWYKLAMNVFDTQVARIQAEQNTCGGGLRWQIPQPNNGYDYKNAISTACYANLGIRLARYTGNQTYLQLAESAWDWLTSVGLADSKTGAVYDGSHVEFNCTDINKIQWSYSAAILAQAAAFAYNFTNGSTVWQDRLNVFSNSLINDFFPNKIAVEIACENTGTCTTDMFSFKGFTHRWLASATQLAPFTSSKVLPVLRNSAQAAVNQCTGGKSGRQCGFYWSNGTFVQPRSSGVGEQMSVLGAVSSLLITDAKLPATNQTAQGGSAGGGGGGGGGSGSGSGGGGSGNGSGSNSHSAASHKRMSSQLAWIVLGIFIWMSSPLSSE